MPIAIYHNPKCSTSRKVLEVMRVRGLDPRVVDYLKTPLTKVELAALAKRLGVSPRAMLRRRDPAFAALNLDDPSVSDDAILDAMAAHPVLLERPVVVTPKGARLCRPPELVDELI